MILKIEVNICVGDSYSVNDIICVADEVLKGVKSSTNERLKKFKGCFLLNAQPKISREDEFSTVKG